MNCRTSIAERASQRASETAAVLLKVLSHNAGRRDRGRERQSKRNESDVQWNARNVCYSVLTSRACLVQVTALYSRVEFYSSSSIVSPCNVEISCDIGANEWICERKE